MLLVVKLIGMPVTMLNATDPSTVKVGVEMLIPTLLLKVTLALTVAVPAPETVVVAKPPFRLRVTTLALTADFWNVSY